MPDDDQVEQNKESVFPESLDDYGRWKLSKFNEYARNVLMEPLREQEAKENDQYQTHSQQEDGLIDPLYGG